MSAAVLTAYRTEVDEVRSLREWLKASGVQFDEAPRHSPAARQRGNGVVKGRADFIVSRNGKQFALELKRIDGGTVGPSQVTWLREFRRHGGRTAICFGWAEAVEQLKAWGFGS